MKLREYQRDALNGICEALRECDSTLLCLPTGTGKTVVFAQAAKIASKRVLIIAHRDELIEQGAAKVHLITGERPEIEKAERYSNERSMFKSKCVVASVQTLNAKSGGARRVERFDPHEFSLLIIDEAHHAVATSYKNVIEHFQQNPSLKLIGVTATPDRTDEVAMKNVFESVAYEYSLREAISDGWLVPVRSMPAHIRGLDLSSLRDVAGDFHQGELAGIMESEDTLHAVASETIARMGKRKVLIFAVSVEQSEKLAEILDRHISGCARCVSGETPPEDRRQMLRDYDQGKFQVLVNCMVATEGFDQPGIGMVVIARPTKSRSLFAQMVGRGTRPLAGVVDGTPETPIERKVAIANSAKPDCIILDFKGNLGKHDLAGLPDILGGKMSSEVIARAKEHEDAAADDKSPIDVIALLELAEKEIEAEEKKRKDKDRRRLIKVKGIVDVEEIAAFSIYGMPKRIQPPFRSLPLSEGQRDVLRKQGVPFERLDSWQQRALFKETVKRFKQNKCSFRQAKLLQRYGCSTDCSFAEARVIIDRLAANGWKATDEKK